MERLSVSPTILYSLAVLRKPSYTTLSFLFVRFAFVPDFCRFPLEMTNFGVMSAAIAMEASLQRSTYSR